jgi:hypothetical protein
MTEHRATDEIIRLGKLTLSPQLRGILDEASRLLANGCLLEAEALLQNLEARFQNGQKPAPLFAAERDEPTDHDEPWRD